MISVQRSSMRVKNAWNVACMGEGWCDRGDGPEQQWESWGESNLGGWLLKLTSNRGSETTPNMSKMCFHVMGRIQ